MHASIFFTFTALTIVGASQIPFNLGLGEGNTVWDVLKSEPSYSEFARLCAKFPRIVSELKSSKFQHTLLVPENEAFQMVLIQGRDLEQTLDYHIINGRKTGDILADVQQPGSKGLFATHTTPSHLKGRLQLIELFYCSWTDRFYVGHSCRAAKVKEGSCQTASNGVIYQINKVLLPPASMLETIANIAPYHAKGSLSMFVSALEIAGMSSGPSYLDEMEGITVFAPSNEAWMGLGTRITQFLMSPMGAKVLRKILQYHISASQVAYSTSIGQGFTSMKTLLPGRNLSITERAWHQGGQTRSMNFEVDRFKPVGSIMLNHRARVLTSDILTDNGVVHVIDQVLLPCQVSFEKVMEEGDFYC